MLNLTPLALRYLLWVIGLRILYIGLAMVTGLPNTLATAVILAAVPAVDIGIQVNRKAQGPVPFAGWVTVWAMLLGIYLLLNAVIPALLVAQFRAVLTEVAGLRSLVIVTGSTAAMLALFLWIGSRARGNRG